MPDKRAVHASVAVNGKIYVFSGWNNKALKTVAVFDTGFHAVEGQGKLATTWGILRAE